MIKTLCAILLLLQMALAQSFYFATWEELHKIESSEDFHAKVSRVMAEFACEECRDHFTVLVQEHPIPLRYVNTTQEAKIWMWLAHNQINQRIGKPWFPLSILEQYEQQDCHIRLT